MIRWSEVLLTNHLGGSDAALTVQQLPEVGAAMTPTEQMRDQKPQGRQVTEPRLDRRASWLPKSCLFHRMTCSWFLASCISPTGSSLDYQDRSAHD